MQIELGGIRATYLLCLHAVADRVSHYQAGLADFAVDGNELGQHVSDYRLDYTDGSTASTPVLRRFAIQQRHITWGASPFAAIPATGPAISATTTEDLSLGRMPTQLYGRGETRHSAGGIALSTSSGSTPCPTLTRTALCRGWSVCPSQSARCSTPSPTSRP